MAFDYDLDFETIDFRKNPELYRVGRGEQGVLLVEPYKSEILKHWRFKNPEIAEESSDKIYQMFLDYKEKDDFVGMDMARKFLQMGYTRARRYTNYKGGKKYDENGKVNERQNGHFPVAKFPASFRLIFLGHVVGKVLFMRCDCVEFLGQ